MGWFAKTRSNHPFRRRLLHGGTDPTLEEIIKRNMNTYNDDSLGLFKAVYTLRENIENGREDLKPLQSELYARLLLLTKSLTAFSL